VIGCKKLPIVHTRSPPPDYLRAHGISWTVEEEELQMLYEGFLAAAWPHKVPPRSLRL
jgi:hypothetical protein